MFCICICCWCIHWSIALMNLMLHRMHGIYILMIHWMRLSNVGTTHDIPRPGSHTVKSWILQPEGFRVRAGSQWCYPPMWSHLCCVMLEWTGFISSAFYESVLSSANNRPASLPNFPLQDVRLLKMRYLQYKKREDTLTSILPSPKVFTYLPDNQSIY